MSAGFNDRMELTNGVEVHFGCALDRMFTLDSELFHPAKGPLFVNCA